MELTVPMEVTESPIVTALRSGQPLYALAPTSAVSAGITTWPFASGVIAQPPALAATVRAIVVARSIFSGLYPCPRTAPCAIAAANGSGLQKGCMDRTDARGFCGDLFGDLAGVTSTLTMLRLRLTFGRGYGRDGLLPIPALCLELPERVGSSVVVGHSAPAHDCDTYLIHL